MGLHLCWGGPSSPLPRHPCVPKYDIFWGTQTARLHGASHPSGVLSHGAGLSFCLGTIIVPWFSRQEWIRILPEVRQLMNLDPKSELHSWLRNSCEKTSAIFLYLQRSPVVADSQHSSLLENAYHEWVTWKRAGLKKKIYLLCLHGSFIENAQIHFFFFIDTGSHIF